VCRVVWPIPVAARSRACFCGRLLAVVAGSNSAEGIIIRLFGVLCVVRYRSVVCCQVEVCCVLSGRVLLCVLSGRSLLCVLSGRGLLCVLSGRGLFEGLITRPEEFYRLWCVVVCDQETSLMRRPWPTVGC
jgi:hypothetical protein